MHDHDRARTEARRAARLERQAERDAARRTPPHGDALLNRRLDTVALHRLASGDYEGDHRIPRA